MTQKGVIYATKMKNNLKFSILNDTMYQPPNGLMEIRIQQETFTKQFKNGERDSKKLPDLTVPRCKASKEEIKKSL